MIFRTLLHYMLVFTVLFASNFAVFHGSEHLPFEKESTAISHVDHISNFSHVDHADHHHTNHHKHNNESTPPAENTHVVEPLCEWCLVLAKFIGEGPRVDDLGSLTENYQRLPNYSFKPKNQAFRTYLSRAPPRNANT